MRPPRGYLNNLWANIKTRCFNPNYEKKHRYFDRGLDIYPPWAGDSALFINDVLNEIGERPSKDYSLDRIDNEKGYWPGNIRWATRSEQALNRGVKQDSRTGYRGVAIQADGRSKPYVVHIQKEGRRTTKCFGTLDEAIAYRDTQYLRLDIPLYT